MLPKQHRLHTDREIQRVYQKGRSARSDLFRVAWLESRSLTSRIAVVTSRKLSTKAVRRNLLKRRVRAIVHGLLSKLTRIDLVIQILPTAIAQAPAKRREDARVAVHASLSYDRLKEDLIQLLDRSHLLRRDNV